MTIETGKEIKISASEILAGQDIEIKGKNVTLVGNGINALENVVSPIKRAGQVEDDRLKALYAYKAKTEIKENGEALQNLGKEKVNISISIGSSKSETTSESQTITNQGSNITAKGDIKITATEKDIEIKGSQIEGKNVELKAKENIRIEAAKNNNETNGETNSSSASIGIDLTSGLINAAYNQTQGSVKENGTSYEQSKITAREELKTETGKDTNIIGSKLEGEKVEMKVGGNLNIESLQDKETYDEKTSSAGFGISGSGITASANKGKTDSNYESVTEQAGIYAGKDGFDIYVENNTDLKGAVIASQAEKEKNKLSTGTLTYGDIENKAEYSSSNVGTSYDSKEYQKDDPNYKNQGLPPVISTEANGSGDSTTKAAIAQGEIEIRNNPSQDISDLSRNTNHALNQLEKIFDKKKIEEQKELANIFGEEIFKAIGDIGLKEGSPEKAALEAFAGGVMSKLGGGSFAEGAMSAGVTQLVISELKNIKDPALLQWAAAIVGAAAAKAIGKSPLTGASIAISEVKNNYLSHWQNEQRHEAADAGDWEKVLYWDKIEEAQNQAIVVLGLYPGIDLNAPENYDLLQAISRIGQDIESSSDFQFAFLDSLPTVDYTKLAITAVGSVVVGGIVLFNYDGAWVKACAAASSTGTVWDKITPTAGNLSGTSVPATFQIQNGQRILWVNSNATKHMGQYINRLGDQSWGIGIRSQVMLSSFNNSVEKAMTELATSPAGRYFLTVGNWELGINTETGVIYHALMK